MSSQPLRTTGKGLLQLLSLSLRTATSSQRTVINSITKKHFSCQRLAFNPTSRLQVQQPLNPSRSRNAEDPSLAAASLSNGDTPSNSSEPEIRDLSAGFDDQNLN